MRFTASTQELCFLLCNFYGLIKIKQKERELKLGIDLRERNKEAI